MSEIKKKKVVRPAKAEVSVAEEVVTPAETPVPKQVAQQSLRVDLATFWRMQHAAAEMRGAKKEAEVAKADIATARMKRLYILQVLDPKGRVLKAEEEADLAKKRVTAAEKKVEHHENEYLILKKQIEASISRPLSNVAIDPVTGEVQAA